VLGWNIAVILWGAYVRATGSGAGCGSHWPLCNGELVPRAPDAAMMIELSHRVTSGLALAAVVVLLAWTFRATPARHPARTGAVLSLFFILTEAAVGAGLVLFRLVADNATMARAMFMGTHLVNTFLLVAALTLTAYWLGGGARLELSGRRRTLVGVAVGAVLLLLTGVSGAIAALGDTLFPAGSLSAALSSDLSATAHILVRLRVLHPALAIGTGVFLIAAASRRAGGRASGYRRYAVAVAALAGIQLAAGVLNIVLLAPVWMQIVHLALADAVWIAAVLLGASLLAAGAGAAEAEFEIRNEKCESRNSPSVSNF
jgi:cytochrome c oxidase assembly protein subunit 15